MPVSVSRFLESLASLGVLDTAALAALESAHPSDRTKDAGELARALVQQNKLTKFQAAAIYQDKADGLLLGNYLVLDKLGAGGMGQVFRARHRRMDRIVAIKVLAKKALEGAGGIERFQREVKAAAKLAHPNIVTAFDADESNGIHFLVMEHVDGSDLSSLVKKHGPLPAATAIDYVRQAAIGLAHAHAKAVIHRDIKPSNLLLDKGGTLKVLDMGLARFSDDDVGTSPASPQQELTLAGSIMGTVDFMAPEQAMDSRKADARSDIYSLGCTLYYLIAGRAPYGGDTVMKRLTAHQQAAIPSLSSVVRGLPPEVDRLFQRMLAKQPAERFQTMDEIVAALGKRSLCRL